MELSDHPRDYRLDDRYRSDHGRVFLSGAQALARLPFEQLRIDRSTGLRTAAYVTGYPGSPLAGFDGDVTSVAALAAADGHHLVFQPAMNEELAATAVMGSQLSVTLDSCRYDGVIGIWYGKTPGLDRAGDALRHAVFAGTSQHGGAVALVGDDPNAKSSTLPSSSDATLLSLHMPVLFPGDVQEAVDLGRHAIAMSRASGMWSAIKVIEAVADGTGTVELHPDRIVPVIPTMEVDGQLFTPRPDGRLLTPNSLELEREIRHVRMELAARYGVANRLNSISVRGPHDWIGIVAAGSTYRETVEALHSLGLTTDEHLRDAGIRLLKLNLPVPIDRGLVREFAEGLAEVFVVEDKNPTLEGLVMESLYGRSSQPVVVGKRTPDGALLLPETGSLSADVIATRLRTRLLQRVSPERLAPPPAAVTQRRLIPLSVTRTPYFCSGCPHNISTQAPEHSLVGGGIGCHTMVMLMEPGPFGDVVSVTAMGNEGAQWFGMAPFVDTPHLIQNIGDGTLFHSGMLAVRAAVANGVNITFKVLYNGAVSMTGGQDAVGQLDVPHLVQVFVAEGVRRVLITTDHTSRYRGVALPPGVEVWDRDRIIEAQQVLAATPGTTVLVHDQRCAAELRRDRKRGKESTPDWRLVIDPRVCEGCGDCGDTSNCLSLQPVDTPYGRKTAIDQASCNFDASCLRGNCPSFLTVTPRRARRWRTTRPQRDIARIISDIAARAEALAPPPSERADCTVRLSGIGGTGVVTVSQILGTAAMLDGFHVRGLDQTGLSQKAGPVVSDVRLSVTEPDGSNRAGAGSIDVLVAFDLLVAASDAHIVGTDPERSVVIASDAAVATGSMVRHPDMAFPRSEALERLRRSSRSLNVVDSIDATTAALGDSAMANIHLLGVAVQRGAIPVDPGAIETAISLNGVAVDKNIAAFRLGRLDADRATDRDRTVVVEPLDVLVRRLRDDLIGFGGDRCAIRFSSVVDRVAAIGDDRLTRAVAVNLHKLMAYKDEYEVARLLLAPESRAAAEAVGGPGAKVAWNLHPPVLSSMGLDHKIRLGRWARPLFVALCAGRRLRGTPFDPFGRTTIRRLERSLIDEYVDVVDRLIAGHQPSVADEAVRIASLPDRVRGYEDIKVRNAAEYRAELAVRLAGYGC